MALATEPSVAPSPAVAPPPGNPRFPLFDSLRAIAVLFIVIFHVAAITGEINRPVLGDLFAVMGNVGPVIFFVISGFLLYRPYAAAHAAGRQQPSTRRYARRRVLRIVPAYWTALTVLAIFPGIVGVFTGDWWRYYFFLQAYGSHTVGEGIPSAWTLSVEVGFYISLPLWVLLVRRLHAGLARPWLAIELGALVLLAAVGVLVQVLASRLIVSQLVATSVLGQATWFALGMTLAVASVVVQRGELHRRRAIGFVVERPGVCWLVGAACLAGVTAILHPGGLLGIIVSLHSKQPFARTLGAIALTVGLCGLLVAPAVFGDDRGGIPRRVLAWAPLAYLGLVSYGVFLYHLTVAELIGLNADPGHFSDHGLGWTAHLHSGATIVLLALTLVASIAIATVSYRCIELPFLRRKES